MAVPEADRRTGIFVSTRASCGGPFNLLCRGFIFSLLKRLSYL